jgi:hypothetical protein
VRDGGTLGVRRRGGEAGAPPSEQRGGGGGGMCHCTIKKKEEGNGREKQRSGAHGSAPAKGLLTLGHSGLETH